MNRSQQPGRRPGQHQPRPAAGTEHRQHPLDTKTGAASRRERRLRRVRPPHPGGLRPPHRHGDIESLTDMTALADDIEAAIRNAITGLREFGYSWADIGSRLGVTRQAAQQRWGSPSRDRRDGPPHPRPCDPARGWESPPTTPPSP